MCVCIPVLILRTLESKRPPSLIWGPRGSVLPGHILGTVLWPHPLDMLTFGAEFLQALGTGVGEVAKGSLRIFRGLH